MKRWKPSGTAPSASAGSLRIKIADLTARSEEQAGAQARLLAELKDVRESLPIQFKAIAQTTLDAAQTKIPRTRR